MINLTFNFSSTLDDFMNDDEVRNWNYHNLEVPKRCYMIYIPWKLKETNDDVKIANPKTILTTNVLCLLGIKEYEKGKQYCSSGQYNYHRQTNKLWEVF